MVYLGECEFCGKRNLNPPNSDFFFSCHHGRTIVSCVDKKCKEVYINTVATHELKTCTFRQYKICGTDLKVNIPRSDGSTTEGVITYQEGIAPTSCIVIDKNNIMFYTEFSEVDSIKCKHVAFDKLSLINTHLPLVKIQQSKYVMPSIKNELKRYQIALNNFCIVTNKATRLVIVSHMKSDGSFACLPRDVISVILKHYYEYYEEV